MNIGIVGAGLIGQWLAYQLKQTGSQITLFTDSDRKASFSATAASAGMLVPLTEMHTAEPVISALGMRSIALWQAQLPKLPIPVFYRFKGSIVTAHAQDSAELAHFKALLTAKMPNGLDTFATKDRAFFEKIGSPLTQGLYFPDDGHIESASLIDVLNQVLDCPQVTWQVHTTATKIKPYQVSTSDHTWQFDCVFDCRGYRAKDRFAHLRGVRGELLYLHAPAVKLPYPIRLLTPRYPIYIVPLSGDRYIVGASEIESEDRSPICVRSTLELLTAAYTVHTGFAEARIVDTKVGLRPALLSNLPQIQYTPGFDCDQWVIPPWLFNLSGNG